ncbi:hypothetical protein H632_c358p0 [Helicosporidium sp. ATCC 50920]|nr:hypothetical protein H632_c358p0 [Helicosporidium sp. ATCC 50920]|eukprot:KDD76096.1 hypothetical protein H632_c358p0 [Helicosporidium sp. ATCC 50920]
MSMIPKDSASVLEYPLQWKYLDNPPRDVSERIKAWVTKRIVELMGEDEESFVGFIMGQISDKSSASEMIAALKDVLDEDTLNFVVKLFQILIYEALKLEHGIS